MIRKSAGMNYQSQFIQPTTDGCVKDAPHSIPDVLDGAQTIAADLIAKCHTQSAINDANQLLYLREALGGRALANAVFSCLGYQLSGSRFGQNWEP